jgi:hypothetical protein
VYDCAFFACLLVLKEYRFDMREYKHLTVFPGEDKRDLDQAKQLTGLSVNQIIVRSVHDRLPGILAEHQARSGRVTNVEPLPAAVLREIYSRPERDEAAVDRLIRKQPKGVRD